MISGPACRQYKLQLPTQIFFHKFPLGGAGIADGPRSGSGALRLAQAEEWSLSALDAPTECERNALP